MIFYVFSRQICESTTPLHPVLPALIEVFVNSALVPASNRASPDGQTVNEPISEHEIRVVFQNPVFDLPCKTSGQTPIRGHRSRESTPFKSKTFLFYLYESLRKWVLSNFGYTIPIYYSMQKCGLLLKLQAFLSTLQKTFIFP